MSWSEWKGKANKIPLKNNFQKRERAFTPKKTFPDFPTVLITFSTPTKRSRIL